MKRNPILALLVLVYFTSLNINLYSQQCEIITKNIVFESSNSITFDVYVKNTGVSNIVYSHSSLAWNYDPSFLNGGTPTFTMVDGYSEFSTNAQPPSALITSPNILRTSSNLPGSNGTILSGQSLRLQRFRLQTSALAFSGSYFNLTWKNSVVPYTRIYTWDSGTSLPSEITTPQFILDQPLLIENFEFTGLLNANGWSIHSGTTNFISTTTGLTYTNYPGSGVGNAALVSNLGGEDVNRGITEVTGNGNSVYYSLLVNVNDAASSKTGDYIFMIGNRTSPIAFTNFSARIFARIVADNVNFGMSNTSTATYGTTNFVKNQTYLLIVKYTVNTAGADSVALWVVSSGVPASEIAAGTPEVLNITTSGQDIINAFAIRQGSNSTQPQVAADGIRITTAWEDLFSVPAGPSLSAVPSSLTNFNYFTGSGPSASQSYTLTGSELAPASGNIVVTGSTNYEVSLNNSTFTSSVNVPYSGAALTTSVYVRLKAGLPGGFYNNEIITNEGGGAETFNVNCSGSVVKPEPTNHVTAFTGVLGNPTYHNIDLSWADASGATLPDGYLIKASDVDFASIIDPVDGTPVTNSFLAQNVAQGLQAFTFGLNSGTTYFFKIYPYSNSGTAINYKVDGSIPQFTIATSTLPSLPITENFDYVTGSNLTSNGWVAHSGAGSNPIQVGTTSLTYTGYVNSGLGKSVTLSTSGEDVNRAFSSITNNKVYASFMVNVTSAQTAGDYFFHLGVENTTSLFYGRVFVKKALNDNLAFGLSKSSTSTTVFPVYTDSIYTTGITYLIVVSYEFISEGDDIVSLWVNPVLDGNEPPANLTHSQAVSDATNLGMFAIRQGSATNAAVVTLGGLRIADTWIPGSGGNTFPLSVSVNNGWNMVSVPGLHPTNQDVTTWWSGKDPSAGVFRFSGGYLPVTTTTPGQGYWMKHTGANTYNYPAIQIVAHDPIVAATGWNLIGGYETSVATSGITTTPPGLQSGSVFQYASGYTVATNLVPGYGYWVKLTGAGSINIPTSLAKGLAKNEVNTSDWGKIIITDKSGKSYTLYTVKGEVNLNDFELPPAPPTGMFDVRFGSGRYAEELSASLQTIEMNSLEYPVTVRVENADIRLQDGTGNGLNERLKSGEEVVISNSAINKLMISGEVIPDKYALEQNYPNPFNPSTKIEFSIPEDVNNVTLIIYNALGQRVAELVNSKMEAGKYSYVWNASDIATGLYIYELRTDKFVSVKKMLMLK
jgi:hypothetical protein